MATSGTADGQGALTSRPAPYRRPHLISRAEFRDKYFPQLLCERCRHRQICPELLAPERDLSADFWLVRGDDGECARSFTTTVPYDVRMLRHRLLDALSGDVGR